MPPKRFFALKETKAYVIPKNAPIFSRKLFHWLKFDKGDILINANKSHDISMLNRSPVFERHWLYCVNNAKPFEVCSTDELFEHEEFHNYIDKYQQFILVALEKQIKLQENQSIKIIAEKDSNDKEALNESISELTQILQTNKREVN